MHLTYLLALGATVASTQASLSSSSSDYDFFYFVQQWPSTFCHHTSCHRAPPPYFTIHGLWPDRFDGSYPQFCKGSADSFDLDGIGPDRQDVMSAVWPSLTGPNEGFWGHEWNKHGTCAMDILPDVRFIRSRYIPLFFEPCQQCTIRNSRTYLFTNPCPLTHTFFFALPPSHSSYRTVPTTPQEAAYFQAGLDFHGLLNLTHALFDGPDAPFTPGDTEYAGGAVSSALKAATGFQPLIHCAGGMVTEIWFCIGKDLVPFDCDQQQGWAGRKLAMSAPRGARLGGVGEGSAERGWAGWLRGSIAEALGWSLTVPAMGAGGQAQIAIGLGEAGTGLACGKISFPE